MTIQGNIMYNLTTAEEPLKHQIAQDFFAHFGTSFDKIDLSVFYKEHTSLLENEKIYFLWAEAKQGNKTDIYKSFTQLILTIAKNKYHTKHQPPPFLGAFDAEKIAFIKYSEVMQFLDIIAFDYAHTTPSDHESENFQKMHAQTKDILQSKSSLFYFGKDNDEIKEFIKTNFGLNNTELNEVQITEDNFVYIYIKWLNAVKPSISIDWNAAKRQGILDTDFYLADILSVDNKTLKEKLHIVLKDTWYNVIKGKDELGGIVGTQIAFNDNQQAHKQFWNRYKRPPAEKFWDTFISRRDLLVPDDIRERKGAFFTPQIWVQKAQEYLAQSLGENWQEECYIWDCAAGTGNLLSGLHNKYRIFASDIDKSNVDICKELTKTQNKTIKLNLLEDHIFEFDFLNDEFFDKVDKGGDTTI